jgi:hypothetical protein
MSGGGADDCVLVIGHRSEDGRIVIDLVEKQAGEAGRFNPLQAVVKFVGILRAYGVRKIVLDSYAGQTFRCEFESYGDFIAETCTKAKTLFYEDLEVALNSGEVELLDDPKTQEQLLCLVVRGEKVDHLPGDHDDHANAVAGCVWLMRNAARLALNEPKAYVPIWGGVPRSIPGQNYGVGAGENVPAPAVPAATPPPAYDYNAQSDWKNWINEDGSIRSSPRGVGSFSGKDWGPV